MAELDLRPTHDDVVAMLTKIAMQVANEIREFYEFGPEQPLDLHDRVAGPADQNLDELDGLYHQYLGAAAYLDGQAAERASYSGEPQITADQFAHERVKELVDESLNDAICAVAGEESSDAEWRLAMTRPVGDLILIVDPLDGSSLLQTTGENWSVNFVLYQITESGPDPKMAVSAAQGNEALVADLVNRTVHRHVCGRNHLLTGFRENYRPWSVSVVAASGQSRDAVAALLQTATRWGLPPKPHGGCVDEDPAFDVNTVGGAPALMRYPRNELCFIVIPSWQTVYDAAPLLALALLNDNSFTRIDTKEALAPADIIQAFKVLERPGTAGARPVPPMLLGRKDLDEKMELVHASLLDALHACFHGQMELVARPTRRLRLVR